MLHEIEFYLDLKINHTLTQIDIINVDFKSPLEIQKQEMKEIQKQEVDKVLIKLIQWQWIFSKLLNKWINLCENSIEIISYFEY